ncbi:2-methylcitrate dehydratase PrpD [Arthrobacter ginsengisoli]|uniref:2-methylcitrate dehydratase PrpD n=1 Tax=Arthrobacter ginsengisoli TaxID=1356565 RepID=A0ABU1UDG8_9MICC|nr:MmgE/PrpD family protein [Arthrobacter ginsengisoli]MDR7083253.1 2-methylcitrate dehydratase PrpD [Arthrobacter ginsengisoli]
MTEHRSEITAQLAAFISNASMESLPTSVTTRLKLHILDTLGCALAFADLPWSRNVWDYVRSRGAGGSASVLFYGVRMQPETAALANASFAHGFELDDTEMRTASHPGVVVVPAALSMAEHLGATGAQLLAAVAVGYETMIRVGVGGVGMTARGFQSTAMAGSFGAAAAAASLMRLDSDKTAHALGICASRAAGIAEYTISGGSVKRLHAGFAAQAGVEAAGLASAGATAPRQALEGRRGLYRAITDTPDPNAVTAGLGSDFLLLGTGFKPHSCCAAQHSVLDAVSDLQSEHAFTALDVSNVHVRQNPREFDSVGQIRRPADVISSQFSGAFGIALRLVKGGNGPRDYLDAVLDDEDLLNVVDKVTYERTTPQSALEGDAPSEVRVKLTDGHVFETYVSHARGTAQRPLLEDEVLAKFRDLAAPSLGRGRAEHVIALVQDLEHVTEIEELSTALKIA